MGSSEELSVSVYLTMVFSNKMMKGLLIVLSEALRRQQAYWVNVQQAPAGILEYVVHDTTLLTHREKRKTNNYIFI